MVTGPQSFDLRLDAYQRPVKAKRTKTYDGKIVWEIETAPYSQRDEGERIHGLSDDNIRALAAALRTLKLDP